MYPNSVRKEWDRRLGEAKIAKFAHDWGFRALGRDRPYTVPAGKNEAVFVRQDAWFAILPDGTMSRHALSAQVARPVYQIPILLTAIRAIFANQRYTDRSKGASLRCVSRHGKGQV